MSRRKNKKARDEDRDISEKIALGMARPKNTSHFDERLYN